MALLPKTKPLAWPRGEAGGPIAFNRRLRRDPRYLEFRRTITDLSEDWPLAASAVEGVRASRKMRPSDYAGVWVYHKVSVGSSIRVSTRDLQSPTTDAELLGDHVTGFRVGSTFSDVLVHEWGHVLVLLLLYTRYPPEFVDQGLDDLMLMVEQRSPIPSIDAAPQISTTATYSDAELTAEAFTDWYLNREKANPYSIALVTVLAELWAEPYRGLR